MSARMDIIEFVYAKALWNRARNACEKTDNTDLVLRFKELQELDVLETIEQMEKLVDELEKEVSE